MKARGFAYGAALFCVLAGPARAQGVEDFYRGKTLDLYIGFTVGGGYDLYARLVGRFMGDHVPGKPRILPKQMTGAGSRILTKFMYSVAPKDGTVLGAIHPGNIIEPVLGDKRKVRYDPGAFQYIGNANPDVYVCVVRTDAPATTFEEARRTQLVMGSGGEAASTRDFPLLLNAVLGTKFKVVLGYSGNREVQLAIEKGEIHGQCGAAWASVLATHPDWFRSGLVKVLVQEASIGNAQLDKQGVPKSVDFARTPQEREVLDLVYSQERFGRPYIMASEVPVERIAAMRKAFMDTFRDPAFLAEAKKMNLDVDPMSGEDLQALVRRVYATSAEVVELAKAATAAK